MNTRSGLNFFIRFLKRDWRSGDMHLLMLSLFVAVAAVTTVSFFSDRVQRAMASQASELLAADLIVSSRKPLPPLYADQAQQDGIDIAHTIQTRSVVVADNDELVLSEIKAVSEAYPHYGELLIRSQPNEPNQKAPGIPAKGSVWVEPSLLIKLNIQVGDRLQIGEVYFEIANVLAQEPDRGGSLFQIGPRVLMNLEDLDATGLIGPVSLVSYQLLLAGPANKISAYTDWAETHKTSRIRLQSLDNARPEIRNALERARQFLGLAVIVTIIVCSVAVMVIARHFSEKQANTSAILKTFGASQRFITYLYLSRLMVIAFIASLLGCSFGYLMQSLITELLSEWFVVNLPPAGIMPWAIGLFMGYVVLFGFAVPPILRLSQVPPLRVIQQNLGAPNVSSLLLFFAALISIMVVIVWLAQDIWLSVIALAGVIVAIALAGIVVRMLLAAIRTLPRRSLIWRYGLSNVLRHKQLSFLQLTAFSLSAMVLLLLTLLRVDLLKEWQLSLDTNAPNQFLINIQPYEQEPLNQFFLTQDWYKDINNNATPQPPKQFPVVMARLKSINGEDIKIEDYEEDSRTRWVVERDQRLSFLNELPLSNSVLSGEFWNDESTAEPQWSFEESYAQDLGLRVGDQVEFLIAGQSATAPITSIRKIDWDSMSVNFFVLGAPEFLSKYPATYVSSFHLPPGQDQVIAELARKFPGISSIDVRHILKQARNIAEQATGAIEAIFIFTLAACLLVLYASIYASRQTRARETSLLRALGATRPQIQAALAVEFAVLGFLAGCVAALVAGSASFFIAKEVFDLPYHLNLSLLIGAIGLCMFITTLAGVLGTRGLLKAQPIEALKHYDLHA